MTRGGRLYNDRYVSIRGDSIRGIYTYWYFAGGLTDLEEQLNAILLVVAMAF